MKEEYRLRLPGGDVVSSDFTAMDRMARQEAHEEGAAVIEVHYPGGGGYLLRYTRTIWGTVVSAREPKTWR